MASYTCFRWEMNSRGYQKSRSACKGRSGSVIDLGYELGVGVFNF